MNLNDVHQTSDNWNLPFPKCPYNKSLVQWVLRLGVIALGTLGLLLFNLWISGFYLIFSVVYTFLLMPFKHCQYCYYNIKEIPLDNLKGTIFMELLPINQWKDTYLKKHVVCGKKWGAPFLFVLWLTPIALIIVSLVLSFSTITLIVLISFILVLAVMGIHMRWRVCPTCAFMEECHSAF